MIYIELEFFLKIKLGQATYLRNPHIYIYIYKRLRKMIKKGVQISHVRNFQIKL